VPVDADREATFLRRGKLEIAAAGYNLAIFARCLSEVLKVAMDPCEFTFGHEPILNVVTFLAAAHVVEFVGESSNLIS
jgi:hypothetical protein